MRFTIEITLGVKDASTYCNFEVEDIDSDDLMSVLNSIEEGIVSVLHSKFILEEKPND